MVGGEQMTVVVAQITGGQEGFWGPEDPTDTGLGKAGALRWGPGSRDI